MLIATFTDATAWSGRKITCKRGVYELDQFGPITALDVLRYVQSGTLAWASEEVRQKVNTEVIDAGKAQRSAATRAMPRGKKKGGAGKSVATLVLVLFGLLLLTPLIGPVSLALMGVLVFVAIVWALRRVTH